MIPVWPASLPEFVLRAGYEEAPRDNVVAFAPDDGPPIERPKRTVDLTDIAASMRMSGDQYALFVDFVRRDLGQGAASFFMAHPRTREQVLVRLSGSPRWRARSSAGDFWIVSFQLTEGGA